MRNRTWVGLLATMFCALVVACGSSNNPPAASTGGSGKSGGSAGDSGGTAGKSSNAGTSGSAGSGSGKLCVNDGVENSNCQMGLSNEPTAGDCAPKGDCCHRASNIAKEKLLSADAPAVVEYRIHYNGTLNHPKTIGSPLPVSSNLAVYTLEAQDVLWRFELPRKGGMEVDGPGTATFGYGRYNCDGTYSFYSDKAAPMGALSNDPTRWAGKTLKMTVDTTKTSADRFKFAFADEMPRRQFINLPYVDQNKDTYPLDWELSFMGFHLVDFKTEGAGRDCVGKVGGTNGWTAGGTFEVYTPVFGNNKSVITALGVTYCTLVSFGIGASTGLNCETEDRCMPGILKNGGGSCMLDHTKYPAAKDDPCCPWLKLPDALCPATDPEQGIYNCHLGAMGNPNMETGYPSDADLKCTMDKPTTALDPDKGATNNGQCCDPMNKGAMGLPGCNSYRLVQEFVAAASEITDKPADSLQTNCALKM